MIHFPPHLPKRRKYILTKDKRDMLIWFFIFICVSFLSGISATFVAVAWIVPSYTPNTVIYSVDTGTKNTDIQVIDPLFVRQNEKQILRVYDSRNKLKNGIYKSEALLGSGVLLTSDGWFAIYLPGFFKGTEYFWEIVDYKGIVYNVQEVVVDPLTDIVYGKIEGGGFFATSFASYESFEQNFFAWGVYENTWIPLILGEIKKIKDNEIYKIWEPRYEYSVSGVEFVGTVLLDRDGRFMGFATKNKTLLPSIFIDKQYSTVFDKKQVSYYAVPWIGYFVDGKVKEGRWQEVKGFYITKSSTIATQNLVGAGDLITHIQGKQVEEKSLGQDLLFSPNEINVTVLRGEEKVDIMIEKEKLIL